MLPEITPDMREAIIQKSSTLIAKANAPKALLSIRDMCELTAFAYNGTTVQQMMKDPDFPAPVMVGKREKRWFSGEFFRFLQKFQNSY